MGDLLQFEIFRTLITYDTRELRERTGDGCVMKAIQITETGGPEVLRYSDLPDPRPGPNQVLVKLEAVGLNYIDTYQRSGLYPVELPTVLGLEGAGVIERLGEGADAFAVGSRVAFCRMPGAYAEKIVVDQDRLVELPSEIGFPEATALMIQGLTAHYLTHSTYALGANDICLLHAAAGGVGLLLTQIAKRRGARVIGTVSTREKAELAKEAGADEVILYTETDFLDEVMRLTEGQGVNVVYDSVGQATFLRSLQCLRRRGTLVSFGQASGPIEPFAPGILSKHGSLYLTRPTLFDYVPDRGSLQQRADDLFKWYLSGELKVRIGATFSLAETPEAHRALEGRKTTGKVILLPGQ